MKLTFGSAFCSIFAIGTLCKLFTCKNEIKSTQARAIVHFNELKPYIVNIDRDNKTLYLYSDNLIVRQNLILMAPTVAINYNWTLVVQDTLA